MRQKMILILFCYCTFNTEVFSQFYNSFENSSFLQRATAAIELGDGFVFGFTESNSQQNFHENILLIKTSVSGNIIWSKRYDAGTGISLQLTEMLRTFDNEILISGQTGIDINFKTHSVSWQRQYNTSNQFTAFLSTRCRNGDIVYLAGRTSGGVLEGTSRIFRTTANGNLLWAKNIKISYDNNGQITSIFDIVNQVYIHEDVNGNIVAFVQDESTRNVMLVFDAAGNYLYNRFFNSPENFIIEVSNGSYLHTCPFSNTPGDPLVSNRFLAKLSDCDSVILVKITNGTDSEANLNPLKF